MKTGTTKLLLFMVLCSLIFITNNRLNSQSFSISEIDASEFPLVKAGFVALDATGKNYENLEKKDFSVIEDAISMNPTLEVECHDEEKNPEVSIVMVLDQSGSMDFIDTSSYERRFQWVIEGVTDFINTLKFEGRTKMALTTFGSQVYLECPFTNDKQRLLDSLETIMVSGATRYDPPFLNPQAGAAALLAQMPSDMRRICIFLTDGNPNKPPLTDSIINVMQRNNVQVYAITLTMPMNKHLEFISRQTGGSSFAVFTKKELKSIYKFIALDIQTKRLCTISWIAPYGCIEADRYRDVTISFIRKNITIERTYVAPPYSIAEVETPERIVSFGNPPALGEVSKTISFTPAVTDFEVSDIVVYPSPNDYFEVVPNPEQTPPFTLAEGETLDVVVKFTQGALKDYRQAELILDGGPCPPTVTMIGGYSQVHVIHPDTGGIYSTCYPIDILWGGVEPNVPVDLFYSKDNGNNWTLIVSGATGLSYRWMPPEAGTQFLIKATVSEQSLFLWSNTAGGTEHEKGESIALDDRDELHAYVVGHFEGVCDFSDEFTLASTGGSDIFVAKYETQEGNCIWAFKAGGRNGMDSARGVCLDPDGNIYVTGVCYKGARFGAQTPTMEQEGKPYCFLARYAPDGRYPNVKVIGAKDVYTGLRARGLMIRWDEENEEIVIKGEYTGQINFQGVVLPRSDDPAYFTLTYDKNMQFKSIEKSGTNHPDYSKSWDMDSEDSRFATGVFYDDTTFGKFSHTELGKGDMYIYKYGTTPGSEDLSDNVFSVQQPVLEFNEASPLDLGQCTLGDACPKVFGSFLLNTGQLPEEIVRTEILDKGGNVSNDFDVQDIVSLIIEDKQAMDVELTFLPQATGFREATLTVYGDCADPISIDLIGEGICTAEVVPLVDMGQVNVGLNGSKEVECIFKNTNTMAIRIEPVIEGDHPGDFKLTYPNGDPITTMFVEADSCKTMKVVFTPTQPGDRLAYINYNMPEGCENPHTDLTGFGVDADIIAKGHDWGKKRVLGTFDENVIVYNNSVLPANVTDIQFETAPGPEFTGDLSFRGDIPAGDSLEIPVSFIPQVEGLYQNAVLITVEALQAPLRAELDGFGILPVIEPVWICDFPVKPGEKSTAFLNITNTSQFSDLYIESVEFENPTADFAWQAGTAPADFTILPGVTEQIPVDFTPQATGTRAAEIIITSDAYDGTETGPAIDRITAECDALGLTIEDPIECGNILICDGSEPIPVMISNKGGSTPVTVTGHYFSNADSAGFAIAMPDEFTIDPDTDVTIYVQFNPTEEREYRTVLHLVNSIDEDVSMELIGYGDIIHYYTSEKEIRKEPGFRHKIPVSAKIADLANDPLEEITLQLLYDENMLMYEPGSFKNALNNWTWEQPLHVGDGILEISGAGTLNTPFDGKLFDIDFQIFLCDVESSELHFQPVHADCDARDTLGSEIELINICYLEGRLIQASSTQYSMGIPKPNPAGNETSLELGIGLDSYTRVELINSLGNVEHVLLEGNLKSGIYDLTLRLDQIPSGVYIVRMVSGPYTESRRLMIAK